MISVMLRMAVEKLAPYAASVGTRTKELSKPEMKALIEAAANTEHAMQYTNGMLHPVAVQLSLPKLLFETVCS